MVFRLAAGAMAEVVVPLGLAKALCRVKVRYYEKYSAFCPVAGHESVCSSSVEITLHGWDRSDPARATFPQLLSWGDGWEVGNPFFFFSLSTVK